MRKGIVGRMLVGELRTRNWLTPKKEEKNFNWDPTTPSKEELI